MEAGGVDSIEGGIILGVEDIAEPFDGEGGEYAKGGGEVLSLGADVGFLASFFHVGDDGFEALEGGFTDFDVVGILKGGSFFGGARWLGRPSFSYVLFYLFVCFILDKTDSSIKGTKVNFRAESLVLGAMVGASHFHPTRIAKHWFFLKRGR